MSIFPVNVDFTARDTEAILFRLFRAIQSVFPQWSDRSVANFGNILLEGLGFTGDVKGFYQDSQAREAFLVTATQLKNVLRHARRNSYVPGEPSASTADVVITLTDGPAVKDVPIVKGSIIRSKSVTDPTRWQILADTVLPALSQTITVSVENSETFIEIFESPEAADFEVRLEFSPFLSVVSLQDATGVWSLPPVNTFLDSGPGDKVVRQFRNDSDQGLLRAGDGTNGKIPVGDFEVEYKVGGGAVGAEQNTLEVPEFVLTNIDGDAVNFSLTNPAAAVPGSDRESSDEIRVNAPAALRTNIRSVTQDDFAINAKLVSGVARALILTSDDLASIAENFGQLYIVAFGATTTSGRFKAAAPTQALLDQVDSFIRADRPPTITFDFNTTGAILKSVDVTARVFLAEGATPATVDANVRTALEDFMAVALADRTPNPDIGFGFEFTDENGDPDPFLAFSDIFNAVRDASGVRKVDRDTFLPAADVALTLNEFPVVGTVTILNATTGLPLV